VTKVKVVPGGDDIKNGMGGRVGHVSEQVSAMAPD
jgi:hypothetical protein